MALLAALVAAALLPVHADAAPKPLLTDPKGDARALGSGYDIVSADLSTSGTTKKVRNASRYTPVYLVATVTLAGPPSTQLGATITLRAKSSGCHNGSFTWSYTPGSKLAHSNLFVLGCGNPGAGTGTPSEFVPDSGAVVVGNTIRWRFKLKELAPDLPLGSTFRSITAQSDIEEPVFNLFGTSQLAPEGDIDFASTKAVYELT